MGKIAGFGGYWVSPEGRAYKVLNNHFEYVQKFPERFGLKPSQVRDLGLIEVCQMADALIRKGWVRARDRGFHGWIFQVADVNEQLGVVAEILSRADVGPEELVNISDMNAGGSCYIGEVGEVFSGKILLHPLR